MSVHTRSPLDPTTLTHNNAHTHAETGGRFSLAACYSHPVRFSFCVLSLLVSCVSMKLHSFQSALFSSCVLFVVLPLPSRRCIVLFWLCTKTREIILQRRSSVCVSFKCFSSCFCCRRRRFNPMTRRYCHAAPRICSFVCLSCLFRRARATHSRFSPFPSCG